MAYVEYAYAFTDDHVFLVDTRRVLDRHVEACKLSHLCA